MSISETWVELGFAERETRPAPTQFMLNCSHLVTHRCYPIARWERPLALIVQ